MDKEAWHAAVHGVTKSWTWLTEHILLESADDHSEQGGERVVQQKKISKDFDQEIQKKV